MCVFGGKLFREEKVAKAKKKKSEAMVFSFFFARNYNVAGDGWRGGSAAARL